MKRRQLLRGALAAGLIAPALAALIAARTDVDHSLSPDPPQELPDLEAAAESYGRHLCRTPPRSRRTGVAGRPRGMTSQTRPGLLSRQTGACEVRSADAPTGSIAEAASTVVEAAVERRVRATRSG